MELFLKKTQTLIGSKISSMLFNITRRKAKSQGAKSVISSKLLVQSLIAFLLLFLLPTTNSQLTTINAIVDPLSVPNNRFGIHIIQATHEEASPAAQLVNTNGDWGYITVLVESKDRNHEKWQNFFNDLRRRHLIPLVRLATQPEGNFWKLPYEGEEQAWADFLDALNWPTKNRYIIIYNEPNHAKEWGNLVDAASYAKVLDKTITALKNKNKDFFVLNAGLDASTPPQPPAYEEESNFLNQMEKAVPGIFNKLDGWVSHSYPNPAFAGSPEAAGKGTVRTYAWELQILRELGVTKNLPIFIAETGWKHAEGLSYNSSLPTAETVANYYKNAFENAWSFNKIVAVTPFLLSYQDYPFDHFSFKKITGERQAKTILGTEYPDSPYYPMFQTIQALPKVIGKPVQDKKAELKKGEVYTSIVSGESYKIYLTFRNTGQSIWNDGEQVKLTAIFGGKDLGITDVNLPNGIKVEPGGEHTFTVELKAPLSGTYKVSLNLFSGEKQFDSKPVEFTTEVKSPVILKVISSLGWKKDFAGSYILKVKGASGESAQSISLNKTGASEEIEARYLLPDYAFEFSLEKPFYYPKSINQKVYAGVNILDFGVLQPNIFSTLLQPKELWKILPFSN